MLSVLVLALAVVLATAATTNAHSHDNDFVIEVEFERVSCGSAVKLAHVASGFRLHSHGVNYGSGSGQQSVTAFPSGDDPNSYFVVHGAIGAPDCARGQAVRCGDGVRLQHMNTKKFLHSHQHASPLSSNQEVSAYEHSDEGDNWKLVCEDKKAAHWKRESKVRLQHMVTGKFLSSNSRHQFRHPIPGQLEVSGTKGSGSNE
ncbi:Stromal cell-derived factor 2-like protein 1, partial [Cladochytrium tenue]